MSCILGDTTIAYLSIWGHIFLFSIKIHTTLTRLSSNNNLFLRNFQQCHDNYTFATSQWELHHRLSHNRRPIFQMIIQCSQWTFQSIWEVTTMMVRYSVPLIISEHSVNNIACYIMHSIIQPETCMPEDISKTCNYPSIVIWTSLPAQLLCVDITWTAFDSRFSMLFSEHLVWPHRISWDLYYPYGMICIFEEISPLELILLWNSTPILEKLVCSSMEIPPGSGMYLLICVFTVWYTIFPQWTSYFSAKDTPNWLGCSSKKHLWHCGPSTRAFAYR